MSEREREWRFYIDDMLIFTQRAIAYSKGLSQAEFVDSGLNYDATVRNIELIGEAASRLPTTVREAHGQIPWRQLIATRNRLVHGYLGIDNDTLWSIIEDDLPVLLVQLMELPR